MNKLISCNNMDYLNFETDLRVRNVRFHLYTKMGKTWAVRIVVTFERGGLWLGDRTQGDIRDAGNAVSWFRFWLYGCVHLVKTYYVVYLWLCINLPKTHACACVHILPSVVWATFNQNRLLELYQHI